MTAPRPAGADWSGTPHGLRGHVVRRGATPLHYWTGGPSGAPPITFLHGACMDHRMFNAQVPAVLDRYRVLVWDARGHGRSRPFGPPATIADYVDDLAAVLDDAGIDRTIVVGQSMGAYTAQHAIRLHPERFAALAVVGCTPIASPVSAVEAAVLRASFRSFGVWPRGNLEKTLANATSVRDDVRAYAREAIGGLGRREIVRIFAAVATALTRTGFPGFRVRVPFLLTHGEHDGTGRIRAAAPGWAAADPAIAYTVIPDAGHNANQDAPERFNDVLLRFLAGLG